jgi:hypothetical protein
MRLAWLGAFAFAATLAARALLLSRRRRRDLERKVVAIADGSSGLGLELARVLADRGAYVAISGDAGPELERATRELRGRGHDAIGVPCDVRSRRGAAMFAEAAAFRWGRLDVVIEETQPSALAIAAGAAVADRRRSPLVIQARGNARKVLRSMYHRR